MIRNPHGQFEWHRRRKIINITLIFFAAIVTYLTVFGEDTELNRTIVTAVIILAGSVIGTYVFGAVWDDRNARKFNAGAGEGG